jgi:hypothetical protein
VHGGSENLSNQTFRPISHYRSAEFPGGHDPQPGRRGAGRRGDDGQQSSVRAPAAIEDVLELAAPTQLAVDWQALHRHRRRD